MKFSYAVLTSCFTGKRIENLYSIICRSYFSPILRLDTVKLEFTTRNIWNSEVTISALLVSRVGG